VTRRADESELVIYVAIDQDSAPLLHADLVRFRKGPKRVQRLRMLALQGLIFETGAQPKAPRPQGGTSAAGGVFSEPTDD
jgi:hypothetical protein